MQTIINTKSHCTILLSSNLFTNVRISSILWLRLAGLWDVAFTPCINSENTCCEHNPVRTRNFIFPEEPTGNNPRHVLLGYERKNESMDSFTKSHFSQPSALHSHQSSQGLTILLWWIQKLFPLRNFGHFLHTFAVLTKTSYNIFFGSGTHPLSHHFGTSKFGQVLPLTATW